MRITMHNGRSGKNGVYSAKHNDRNFDITKEDHIDQEKTNLNWYWQRDKGASSFEENERRFYEHHFKASLEAKNERYKKQGHSERIRTMDEYRASEQACPEETILQIGKMGDDINSGKLLEVMKEQVKWEQQKYPNCKYLDMALHMDEQGAPHIHMRKVWLAHDKDGNATVGQKKALLEMGVSRPDPSKPSGKYNNEKQTYSSECREHLIEVVRQIYPEIEKKLELEPLEASKKSLELLEYQRAQAQKKLELEQIQAQEIAEKVEEYEKTQKKRKKELAKVEAELQKTQKSLQARKKKVELYDKEFLELDTFNANLDELEKKPIWSKEDKSFVTKLARRCLKRDDLLDDMEELHKKGNALEHKYRKLLDELEDVKEFQEERDMYYMVSYEYKKRCNWYEQTIKDLNNRVERYEHDIKRLERYMLEHGLELPKPKLQKSLDLER